MGRNWAPLGGENSQSKGFWGRWQANGCFWRCRGEWFCAGSMVARQTAPGCTQCVRTEKGSARTKRARAEAPRTGVYIISAWNVRRTRRTGCNRAQGSIFADVVPLFPAPPPAKAPPQPCPGPAPANFSGEKRRPVQAMSVAGP